MEQEYQHVPITAKIYERLLEQSQEENRTPEEIVNDLLKRHQFKRLVKKMRQEIEPQASAIGWNSDEDIFREVS